MSQQYINIGATPNDGLGDPIRTAFQKTNENFAELYANSGNANINLSNISTNIIPSANVTYSLGNSTRWWANAWFGSNTIYIGGIAIGVTGNSLTVGNNVVVTTGNTGTTNLGNLEINNTTISSNAGNILITSNSNSWEFQSTGNLTLPGNIIMAGATSLIGDGSSPAPSISGFDSISAVTMSASGNISSNYFFGNGSQLTGITASNVDANALVGNTLSANITTSSLTTLGTLGTLSVSGATTSGNIFTNGRISAFGNVVAGNILTPGQVSTSGNIYANNFIGTTEFTSNPVPYANLSLVAGSRSFINDSNLSASGNFGAVVSGGGANIVPVWSDGTNWYIG